MLQFYFDLPAYGTLVCMSSCVKLYPRSALNLADAKYDFCAKSTDGACFYSFCSLITDNESIDQIGGETNPAHRRLSTMKHGINKLKTGIWV